MLISGQPVKLDIHKEWGRVETDSSPSRADMGIKTHVELIKERVQVARAEGVEAIGDKARRGDRLARIEEGYTIADDAKYLSEKDMKEINVWYKRLPDVQGFPGGVEMNVVPRGSRLNVFR